MEPEATTIDLIVGDKIHGWVNVDNNPNHGDGYEPPTLELHLCCPTIAVPPAPYPGRGTCEVQLCTDSTTNWSSPLLTQQIQNGPSSKAVPLFESGQQRVPIMDLTACLKVPPLQEEALDLSQGEKWARIRHFHPSYMGKELWRNALKKLR